MKPVTLTKLTHLLNTPRRQIPGEIYRHRTLFRWTSLFSILSHERPIAEIVFKGKLPNLAIVGVFHDFHTELDSVEVSSDVAVGV